MPRPLRHRVSSRYVRHRGLPQWQAEAKAFLTASERQESAGEFLDFYLHSVHRGQPAYDSNFNYMLYRFGMPRHLSAISLASIIRNPEGPILELGCGCGHTTRTWLERGRGQPVVGIDNCFWALFVAKNWIAPQASYICCEADRSLPFVEHSFAVISANDAFHCFRDKTGSMREFRRVKRPGGAFVLTGMANVAASTNIGTTYRLHPAGYQRLVRDLPHRLVSDAQVLERYLGKHGPALKHYIHPQRLLAERFLSLVVSEDESLFQDYEAFEDWPHAQGELRLNPLFVPASQMGDSVCLRRQFPSEKYAAEHVEFERYLPKEIELSTQLLADVAAGRRTKEMEHLLSRCVIVGMPERFLPPATDLVQRLAAQATERECRSTFASARALVAALLALCQSHLYSWSEVVGDLLSL